MGIQKKLFVAINSCDLSELSKAKTENLWASQSMFEIKKEGSKFASFSRKFPYPLHWKSSFLGKKLSDEKSIGGKGRLTLA